tara:strand:+ start:356 stop:1681 length:1326 start_codon:yes stop_codon:yes gene_type:complete
MNFFFILILLFFIQGCSFDNKSGVWKNESTYSNKNDDIFKDFKSINIANRSFQKTIPIKSDFKFPEISSVVNYNWNDIYYNQNNNLPNFSFSEKYNLIFKSKKVTKYKVNEHILFEDNNAILTDSRGNIILFSINENKLVSKYNFYKKKYKKINKKLYKKIEKDILYVFDNLGYFYAFNYKQNKILWAQKHDVAFQSNVKIYKEKIIISDQNNRLYFINKKTGEKLAEIPTEETVIKNNFENNLSLDSKLLFYINTFGSLYLVNAENMKILWFINLNQSLNLNPRNIFVGSEIINYDDKILISSNENTYVINQNTGSTLYKKNFASDLKPIIINKNFFTITKNKFLIAMNTDTGKIIYSYDLNRKIADFLNTKKKQINIKNFMILEGKIVIFLKNSYILIFNINGNLQQVKKLPSKINTLPIIIDKSILYLDQKNRISILN